MHHAKIIHRTCNSNAWSLADNSWNYRGRKRESERPWSVISKSQRFTCIKSLLLRVSLTDGQTINIELISSWRCDSDILQSRYPPEIVFSTTCQMQAVGIRGRKVSVHGWYVEYYIVEYIITCTQNGYVRYEHISTLRAIYTRSVFVSIWFFRYELLRSIWNVAWSIVFKTCKRFWSAVEMPNNISTVPFIYSLSKYGESEYCNLFFTHVFSIVRSNLITLS